MDYVGLKSKGGGKRKNERGSRGKGKTAKQINPTRLFVTGLIEGMTEDKLKQLFPKCYKANIPKGSIRKGTLYGFVQFDNPADAKSAFEAAKKLTVQTKEGKEAQRITVLYATASNHPINSKKIQKGNFHVIIIKRFISSCLRVYTCREGDPATRLPSNRTQFVCFQLKKNKKASRISQKIAPISRLQK